MRKIHNNHGITLLELTLALGIIVALLGVGFISVHTYLRSMTKLEYDGYAKEIFIAAQNHLTMAESQGYLGLNKETDGVPGVSEGGDVYHFACVRGDAFSDNSTNSTLMDLMLPFGSIDDTVRKGGCFIVRYHWDSAQVLDAFYWAVPNSGGRFPFSLNHEEIEAAYTADFLEHKNDRSYMIEYGDDKSVIGYYGGVDAEQYEYLTQSGITLEAPTIAVTNGDTLEVKITHKNRDYTTNTSTASIKLLITGETSRAKKEISITPNWDIDSSQYTATVVLDDITTPNLHFMDVCGSDFIPGEDITIQAVAYNNTIFTNVGYSSKQVTNSLFDDSTKVTDGKAGISYIRHLENLDRDVSLVNDPLASIKTIDGNPFEVKITSAVQNKDLNWKDFFEEKSVLCANLFAEPTHAETYRPVTPLTTTLLTSYDGKRHSIKNIPVNTSGSAGLFGTLTDCTVKDLKLVDFTVSGTNSGALAGSATNTKFTNVLAYNTHTARTATITGSGSVGGLIGAATDCTVEKCAAALVVRSTGGDAGGLIGTANETVSGRMTVAACHSGGHTHDGAYDTSETPPCNVTGKGSVGGLIGSFTGTTIEYSYSTCSAGGGMTVGGLVGTAAVTGEMKNCYATGKVSGTAGSEVGAFAGSITGTVTGCHYYEIVNVKNTDDEGYHYLSALGGDGTNPQIVPFDKDKGTYDAFVGTERATSHPYDSTLTKYFQTKYPLPTVEQLGYTDVGASDFVKDHYGDWPAPETWVINVPS